MIEFVMEDTQIGIGKKIKKKYRHIINPRNIRPMTELEELERNAKIEYAKQRSEELNAYHEYLKTKLRGAAYWHNRGLKLELATFVTHIGLLVTCPFLGLSEVFVANIILISTNVMFVAFLRSTILQTKEIGVLRELIGSIETLKILGFIDLDDDGPAEPKKVKKQSLFERYKEFWERMSSPESRKYA